MAQDEQELLDLLKFELRFLEDGGYGRSPHTPWRRPLVFEGSPTCLNFGDPARTHPCTECLLIGFVPAELKDQTSPCRLIPLTDKGETVDYFYRCGTQLELEDALAGWLRNQVSQIEEQREQTSRTAPAKNKPGQMGIVQRRQWLALAGNLYLLANRHREYQNHVLAYSLYARALEAAEKIGPSEAKALSLATRIRTDQQAVFEMLYRRPASQEKARLEEAQALVSIA